MDHDALVNDFTRSNFSLAASVLIWCVRVNRILLHAGHSYMPRPPLLCRVGHW